MNGRIDYLLPRNTMNLIPTQSIILLAIISISFSSIFAFEIDQSTTTTTTFTDDDVDGDIGSRSKIPTFIPITPSASTSSIKPIDDIQPLLIENEPETDTASPNSDDVSSVQPSSPIPAVVTSTSPLQMDLYEFVDLIPVDEVNELRVRYYVSDPNVRKAYDFVRNYNYTFVHTQLYKMVEVKKAFRFFERKGVNLKDVGETLYERLGPPGKTPDLTIEQGEPKNGGFYAMVDNILDEVPQDEVVTLFFEKMETSHDFSELLDWVGGNDFKEMLNVLRVRGDLFFLRFSSK